jgi:hypothetical protein
MMDKAFLRTAKTERRPRRASVVCALLLLIAWNSILPLSRALAAPYHGVNVWYAFTNPGGAALVEQRIRVVRDTPGQYYALTMMTPGDVVHSYFGLQPDGRMPVTNQTARLFRFSVWNADAFLPAPATECAVFTHEGTGVECAIRYPFQINRTYLMRAENIGNDARGRWWAAWILDLTTNQWTYLGQVHSLNTALLTRGVQFTESWRQPIADSCESIRASEVQMLAPFGAANSQWIARYESHSFPSNPCANASLVWTGSPAWGVMRMGR